MSILEIVIAAVNVFLAGYVILLTIKKMKPKLYVDSKIRKLNKNEEVFEVEMRPYHTIDFNQKGFPDKNHESLIWEFYIGNNSEIPATNIVVKYSLIIKKYEFEFGIDEADVINERVVDFKEVKSTILFDYIAPGSIKKVNVVSLEGAFPEADLKVISLTSKEDKYLNKEVIIESYLHPEFNQLQDSHHYRQMIGAYKGTLWKYKKIIRIEVNLYIEAFFVALSHKIKFHSFMWYLLTDIKIQNNTLWKVVLTIRL